MEKISNLIYWVAFKIYLFKMKYNIGYPIPPEKPEVKQALKYAKSLKRGKQ